MKRIDALEARRRALLARCDQQRVELAYRLEQFRPSRQITQWTSRGPQAALSNPIAWLAGLASLVVLLKPGRMLAGLAWVTGAISLAGRVVRLLRLLQQFRGLHGGGAPHNRETEYD